MVFTLLQNYPTPFIFFHFAVTIKASIFPRPAPPFSLFIVCYLVPVMIIAEIQKAISCFYSTVKPA
jgi:hypothetical protein